MRTDFTPRLFMDPQADLRAAQELVETVEVLKDSFKSLGIIIKEQINNNIQDANDFTKAYGKSLRSDITQAVNNLGKRSSDILKNQEALIKGQAKEKDILKQITQNELKRKNLSIDLENAIKNNILSSQEANNLAGELIQKFKEQNEELAKQATHAAKIEGAMGNLGIIVKGLNKIPILGGLINSEKVIEKMQETAAKTKDQTAVMATGFKEVGKSIRNGILDPLTITTFLINSILKANRQTVELGKLLGKDSYTYRENLAAAARFSSNNNVTTENLVGAFNELTTATGLSYEYSVDQLETQVKLTKQVGLQADEAAQIQKFGVLNNKTSEQTYNSFIKGLTAARNQLKVGINFKATLAEASKVSGQLAANLGYNPERIAKAVVSMKAFGITLEQTKAQGESLLNWESSIENELQAELITGQQINLERARAAALMGDQVALAEELSNQGMTLEKFSSMNVLAQKSYAQAIGLSADQLSDQLQKQKQAIESGKSLAQITEDEAKTALERQTIQDKFNQTILKLQDALGNIAAGPLGQLVDGFANILKSAFVMNMLFGSIAGIITGKIAMGLAQGVIRMGVMLGLTTATAAGSATIASALTFGAAAIGIAAGIATIVAAMKANQKVEDGIAPSSKGPFTITDAFGSTAITARGDSLAVSPNISGGPSIDLTPMINAINEVRTAVDKLYNKDTSISMDGKVVGSTLVQGSYKLA